MAVYNALSGITGGLQIAGAFTGIPYASALGTLLSGIIEAAQQIVVHKVHSFLACTPHHLIPLPILIEKV